MIATTIATLAILGFLIKNIQKYKNKDVQFVPLNQKYLSAFFAGIVIANGLFHFLHGVLGQNEFPAPFAKLLGHGSVTNICWGLFNILVAFMLIRNYKKHTQKWIFFLLIIVGIVTMSLLMRFILVSGYFSAHSW